MPDTSPRWLRAAKLELKAERAAAERSKLKRRARWRKRVARRNQLAWLRRQRRKA